MTFLQSVPVVLVAILVGAPPTALILRGVPLFSMFVNMSIRNMQQPRPERTDEQCALPSRTDEHCVDYTCPCGFKARLDQAESYCLGPKCDWRDRDVCCTADFRAGLYPSCYGVKIVDDENLLSLRRLSDSSPPINPEWPTLLDDSGFVEPVTSPMLHEMAMDAYRGCAAAFGCEGEDSWMDCGTCVSTHCSGYDPDTQRPKAAPWYPNISLGTSENFLYQFTCDSCYLSDPNGRGDGRKGCSGTDDWLAACTADTLAWTSGEGKTCAEYGYEMQLPMLFHNVTIKREVKQNCCKTWQCTKEGNCPSTVTTTTTPVPQIDLSKCPHDDGCHDELACPCHKMVSQFMGYTPWHNSAEEQKMRANCCQTAGIYEAVKNGETDTAESV